MKALSGKKTYFTAGAAVLTALGAYFAGEVDLTVTIQSCFATQSVTPDQFYPLRHLVAAVRGPANVLSI